MVDIYVLECEDGNVYVGKTTKGEKRLKQHIAGRGAEWTKMHKPKRVMQYYTNATDADERKVTNLMIKKYGAKRVRGAGLTKRKMTKKEIDNLNKKVGFTTANTSRKSPTRSTTVSKRTKTYTCGRCGRQGHNRTQCYAKTNASGKPIRSATKSTTSKKSSAAKKKTSKKQAPAKKIWKPKAKSRPKKTARSTSRKTTARKTTTRRRTNTRRK